MVTHIVGEAWNQFCTKKSLIEKSFVDIGLNIASNGSEDSKLSIKGYEHGKPEIGDWSRIDDNYEGFQEFHKLTNWMSLLRKRKFVLLRIIVDYYDQSCRNS
jgi:hypothetical protein